MPRKMDRPYFLEVSIINKTLRFSCMTKATGYAIRQRRAHSAVSQASCPRFEGGTPSTVLFKIDGQADRQTFIRSNPKIANDIGQLGFFGGLIHVRPD